LPTSSTSKMQPNAQAIAGSMRRRMLLRTPPNERPRAAARDDASAIQVEAVANSQQPDRAKTNGRGQNDSLEQRLPQRFDVEHEEQIADRAEHQRAEDRANRAARTAEQRHAAQHHRGNRI